MKARHKRLGFLAVGVAVLGMASWLVINALGSNLSYFFSPTEVAENKAPTDRVFRLGGLVKVGSLDRGKELTLRFVITDNRNEMLVAYTGILPDLFAEGQGVIAQGRLGQEGEFIADEVLAKHDENYMPPEVQDALAKSHAEGVAQSVSGGSVQ